MSNLVKCCSNITKLWNSSVKTAYGKNVYHISQLCKIRKMFVVSVASYRIMPYSNAELDDNERALKELDITLLKPHPEWRNVAAGPVWGKGNEYYELLWSHWLKETDLQLLKVKQDNEWKEYKEKYGFTPIDYLTSDDYVKQYQNKYTWHGYIRNKKGGIQPQKTRKSCIKKGVIASGSPCALCRDENLLLTYNNIPLIIQFIDALTGELHNPLRTGLCRTKQKLLVSTLKLAQDLGYYQKIVPFLKIDEEEYKPSSFVL